jgi:hypothetical protein
MCWYGFWIGVGSDVLIAASCASFCVFFVLTIFCRFVRISAVNYCASLAVCVCLAWKLLSFDCMCRFQFIVLYYGLGFVKNDQKISSLGRRKMKAQQILDLE